MSPRNMTNEKQDSSVVNDEEALIEQAIETRFVEHPDYRIVDLYEDEDFPEWD